MPTNNAFKSALDYEGKILRYYKYQQHAQNEVLTAVKAALPKQLASHALFCVVAEQKILLYTDSANWSSQLRFYRQQILQQLNTSRLGNFELLQIKIIPATIERQAKPAHIPSAKNISLLAEQAKSQPDAVLKKALAKLACTLRKMAKNTPPAAPDHN